MKLKSKHIETILLENLQMYDNFDFYGFRDWLLTLKKRGLPKYWDSLTYYQVYNIFIDLKNNFDCITIITGYEGSGKSVLGSQIATTVSPEFHKGLVGYDPEDLARMVKDLKKGDTIWLDEGGLFLFSRDANKGANKILIKFLTICRQLNVHVIICVPNMFILDTYLRDHRIKRLFHIVKNRKAFVLFNKEAISFLNYHGKSIKNVNLGFKYVMENDAIIGSWTGDFGTTDSFSELDYIECKTANMKKFADEMQVLLKKNSGDDLVTDLDDFDVNSILVK